MPAGTICSAGAAPTWTSSMVTSAPGDEPATIRIPLVLGTSRASTASASAPLRSRVRVDGEVSLRLDVEGERSGVQRERRRERGPTDHRVVDEDAGAGHVAGDAESAHAAAQLGEELVEVGHLLEHLVGRARLEGLDLHQRLGVTVERLEGAALVVEERRAGRERVGLGIELQRVGVVEGVHGLVGGLLQLGRARGGRVGRRIGARDRRPGRGREAIRARPPPRARWGARGAVGSRGIASASGAWCPR